METSATTLELPEPEPWLTVHISINVAPAYQTLANWDTPRAQAAYTIHVHDNVNKGYRRLTEVKYIDPDYKLVFGLVAISEALDTCVLTYGYDGLAPLEIKIDDPDVVDLVYSDEYSRLPRQAMEALNVIQEAFVEFPKLKLTVAE